MYKFVCTQSCFDDWTRCCVEFLVPWTWWKCDRSGYCYCCCCCCSSSSSTTPEIQRKQWLWGLHCVHSHILINTTTTPNILFVSFSDVEILIRRHWMTVEQEYRRINILRTVSVAQDTEVEVLIVQGLFFNVKWLGWQLIWKVRVGKNCIRLPHIFLVL